MLVYERLRDARTFETLICELPADCKNPTSSRVSYRIREVQLSLSEAAEERGCTCWMRRHYCALYTAGLTMDFPNESFAYYSALDRNGRSLDNGTEGSSTAAAAAAAEALIKLAAERAATNFRPINRAL